MLQRGANNSPPLLHPFVGKVEDFWIFRNEYNPFELDKVVWSTIVTILSTYWLLFVAAFFLPPVYFFIDLYWLLSFDMDGLANAWSNQKETLGNLWIDIFT